MVPIDPSSIEKPAPAEVVQGIGPLFTPPYVYLMFPVVAVAAVVMVPLLPIGGGGGPFAMVIPLLILVAVSLLGVVGTLWPMRLLLGNDGVQVSWLLFDSYISFRDMAEVGVHRSARSRGLLFVTRAGRRIPMPLQPHLVSLGPHAEKLDHITTLLERIGQRALPIAKRVNEESSGAAIDPGTKDALAIVQDAGAPWRVRADAAISLGPLSRESRERLNAVAAASANPKLRRALETVLQ